MKTVHLIAAARPNFMKVAPLYYALLKTSWCIPRIVNVRQHTDDHMSGVFLREFGLDKYIGIDMGQYTDYAKHDRPDAAVVVGDVNATTDCAIAAARLGIPVVHLEAGLRSWDRQMPEEINRIVTDHVSDLLLAPSKDACDNLEGEGILVADTYLVGNIMIDTLEMLRPQIEAAPRRLGQYAVATLHRPSNVDNPEKLRALVDELRQISYVLPVMFPVHPRTRKRLLQFQLSPAYCPIRLLEPMNYVNFMALVKGATIVITDSGGVQEETTYLGIPCATVRENTERPVTLEGTNRLVNAEDLPGVVEHALCGKWPRGKVPPLWDGKTAGRCVEALKNFLGD